MKNTLLYLSLSIVLLSCNHEEKVDKKENPKAVVYDISEKISTLNYNELKPYLNQKDNKTYVVNFWATWCAPCVKELPYFENVNKSYKDKNVEVILVSLDFPTKKESTLIPFVEKKNIQSEVLHLDDTNEQFWIADIAESWTGAIPATLIYNKDHRKFYEQSFTQKELNNEIESFLK